MDLEEQTLRIERTFNAPIESVFEAFTNPEQLVEWWGPEGVHIADYDLNVVKEGAWFTLMESKDGQQFHVSGVYRAIERPSRILFTWAWRQEGGERGHESVVEILLSSAGAMTKLELIQRHLEGAESRDNHGGGWISSFNCLDAFLMVP